VTFERHLVEQLVREEWRRRGHEPFATALAERRSLRRARLLAPLRVAVGVLARHRSRLHRAAPTPAPVRTAP
jgi:hypothetical protein